MKLKTQKVIVAIALMLGLFNKQSYGQQKFSVSGTVTDKSSSEQLNNAIILVLDEKNTAVNSNNYGYYNLSLAAGNYTIVCKHASYLADTVNLNIAKDEVLNFALGQRSTKVAEVIARGKKPLNKVQTTTMGIDRIDMKEAAKLPVLFGEKDIVKTIQLLPGVKAAGEGSSGFSVRGGSTDQNLIILDEAPVYNASHLLGFFSTFNSDALKDATIIKGNSPAEYGGRLSSVLDVKMKEGNMKEYAVNGGIGLIASRLSVEGPIVKDKGSFIVSGRRTYADVFLKATEDFKDNRLYFYDFNAKANYKINDKNRIYASGYFGKDILGFGDQFGIDWGNTTGTLRWNSIINKKLFSNTSLIYSDYKYNIQISATGNTFNLNSSIQDWNLKQDFDYFANNKSKWKFGVQAIRHKIQPSRFEGEQENTVANLDKATRFSLDYNAYASNVYKFSSKFSVDYGLRASFFTVLGGDTFNNYTNGVVTSQTILEDGDFGKTYVVAEPRISFNYLLDNNTSIKAGYARNSQNLHLLSNSTSTNPTDQWIGTSYNTKPEIADQLAVGYFKNFGDGKYELSAETYYKTMSNQIDYKDGADIVTVLDVESQLLYGKGRAYGLEIGLKKKTGKFTGWLSYTLSRTERQIDGINNNNWYLAKQDRLHDLSLVGMYQINDRWNLSSNFIFYTGNAVTFPAGKYQIGGNTTFYYTDRNGARMPNYHRLDISATYEGKKRKKYQGSWNVGLYNVYGRENAYTINFEDDPDNPGRTRAMQTSLFKWVPTITYNFKF
jgi:hypothetical protein